MKLSILLAWVLAVLVAPLVAQDRVHLENSIKPMLAMLDVKVDGKADFGAAIIVGVAADRVYLVTADHVVRNEEKTADSVNVSFSWLPGEQRTGRVLATHDAGLDLAVISVERAGELSIPQLPYSSFVPGASLGRGDAIYAMGNPGGKAWFTRAQAGALEEVTDRLTFDLDVIGGNSGGAALSAGFRIAGLVTSVERRIASAVPIEVVAERLRAWNYPVQWKISAGGSAPTDFRTYVVRFLEVAVKEDGSTGATNWNITATVNGKPLFDWSRKSLDDRAPNYKAEPNQDGVEIALKPGETMSMDIFARHAAGAKQEFRLKQDLLPGQNVPVVLTFPNRKDGDFIFYFSVVAK